MTIEIVAADVFALMGTPADVREENEQLINDLIARQYAIVENRLGRKIQRTTITRTFNVGKGSLLRDTRLYLLDHLRDIVSISSFTENGVALNESTAYNDGKDYIVYADDGYLDRINGAWSTAPNAFTVTGIFGLTNPDGTLLEDLKQYIIEKVALKSGLWVKQFRNSDGTIDVYTKTESNKELEAILNAYIGARNV